MPFRQLLLTLPFFVLSSFRCFAEDPDNVIERHRVPDAIFAEATSAVEKLGKESMKGNTQYLFESMYPRFRERAVKLLGGEEALQEKLDGVEQEMARMGVNLIGFQVEPAYSGFDIPEFNEWLVFVPTKRIVRGIDADTGKVLKYEISDYQVAIRGKEEGAEWSFINGSTLRIQELRSLFPGLPKDREALGLPEMGSRPIR